MGEAFDLIFGDLGCSGILQYCFVGYVTLAAWLSGGCTVGFIVWLTALPMGLPEGYAVGLACVAFVVTVSIMLVVCRVIESGCNTLYVCYAEEPKKLSGADP